MRTSAVQGVLALDDHGEFVAAEAGDQAAVGDDVRDPCCDLPQQGVAGAVSEGVVDRLETLDVENQERHLFIDDPGTGDVAGEPPMEEDTVGQTGEHVAVCQCFKTGVLAKDVAVGPGQAVRKGCGLVPCDLAVDEHPFRPEAAANEDHDQQREAESDEHFIGRQRPMRLTISDSRMGMA